MSETTTDPREQGPKPPHREKPQDHPGLTTEMREKPDHGETTYRGTGRLQDKIALVTGGDSGIGRAVALAFAREGADVAISYLAEEEEDARATEALVREAGRRALLLPGDLANPATCASIVKATVDQLGGLDILVNNAAFQGKSVKDISELDPHRVEQTFRVNVFALFETVRQAVRHMKPGGVIINTASIQGFDPSFHILDYATTKAAIVSFTEGYAAEALERGIRVNAVAPGPVWTPLVAQSFSGKKLREFGEQTPMKRAAQPAELAPTYVFLASEESRFVVGEIIGVTGGRSL